MRNLRRIWKVCGREVGEAGWWIEEEEEKLKKWLPKEHRPRPEIRIKTGETKAVTSDDAAASTPTTIIAIAAATITDQPEVATIIEAEATDVNITTEIRAVIIDTITRHRRGVKWEARGEEEEEEEEAMGSAGRVTGASIRNWPKDKRRHFYGARCLEAMKTSIKTKGWVKDILDYQNREK